MYFHTYTNIQIVPCEAGESDHDQNIDTIQEVFICCGSRQSPRPQSRASHKAGASAIQGCKRNRRLLVKRTARSEFPRPPAIVYRCGVDGGRQPVLFCESVSLERLAASHETPLYLYSAAIDSRAHKGIRPRFPLDPAYALLFREGQFLVGDLALNRARECRVRCGLRGRARKSSTRGSPCSEPHGLFRGSVRACRKWSSPYGPESSCLTFSSLSIHSIESILFIVDSRR